MNYSKQCVECLRQFDSESIDAAGFCPDCRWEFKAMKARIKELEEEIQWLRSTIDS